MGTDRRISGDALRRPSPRRRTGESGTATSSQRVRADLLDARPDFPVPALHVGAHDAYLGIVSKFEPRRAPDPPGRNDLPIQNYNRSFPQSFHQALLHRTAGWACSSDQRADDRGPSGPALVGSSRPSFVTSARRWSGERAGGPGRRVSRRAHRRHTCWHARPRPPRQRSVKSSMPEVAELRTTKRMVICGR
jgi:hypothetical protein